MRILLTLILTVAACGSKKDSESAKSPLLSKKLKNSYWEMPSYPAANIKFSSDGVTVQLNENFAISNGRTTILEEDKDFIVFNVDDQTNNLVVSVLIKDPKTISTAIQSSAGGDTSFRERHNILAQEMVKK
ncbi:hypothetical protein SAMN02745150_01052 [Brevinema andersonii]|uniref:Uncharacterized protein n=1 Tax=Brevinema andersonii TaxID=34097 RepID=A0A1I1EIP8_BREAD|nr:hypothetical protein [Brevinema andersonii]SFB84823.1 hypothetical protein SAMN02745150_01052 [Brevinema andersonii]